MSATPPPVDLDSADAQDRLAQLEALLAGHLFQAEPPVSIAPAPPRVEEPPAKRKKTSHPDPHAPITSEEGPKAEQAVAFRLFSSQKAPQKVVLREAETPPPFVRDPRIRDVEDEAPVVLAARREAIAALAVDGETILSESHTLLASHWPSHRLTHRALSSSTSTRGARASPTLPLPRLAYLNAHLPGPLNALSPHPVPFPEELEDKGLNPPLTPHEGLLAVAPLPGVYVHAPRRRRINGEGKEAHEFVPAQEGVRKGLPPRNPVSKVGAEGQCALVVRAILKEEQPEAVEARLQAGRKSGQGKKRLSKARRAREKKRAVVV